MVEEIKSNFPSKNTSSGREMISPRLLSSVPAGVLVRLYNLMLWCGGLPKRLLASRTVLIPKKADVRSPGDFRPITVSSIISRMGGDQLYTPHLYTKITRHRTTVHAGSSTPNNSTPKTVHVNFTL